MILKGRFSTYPCRSHALYNLCREGAGEGELAVVGVHVDVVAVVELALEELHRKRVLDPLLDRPLERARAIGRIEPLDRKLLFRPVSYLDLDLPVCVVCQCAATPGSLPTDLISRQSMPNL